MDLGQSITEKVSLCPREICSRMHTFMLETSRPATREDRDSMVVIRQGHTTVLRHLLSADSRNERVVWCDILNQALDNLRAWDTVRPRYGMTVLKCILMLSFSDPTLYLAMIPQTLHPLSPQKYGDQDPLSCVPIHVC